MAVFWPNIFPQPETIESNATVDSTTDTTITEATSTVVPEFTCPLDGEATGAQQSLRRPLAVMIENHPDARPQSGLSKTCVVYETVAEGGITRFMAIFLHNDVGNIGPVRSAREYFADLAKQYDAVYSHCGGPATIYDVIKNLGLADLDQYSNGDYYWRLKTRHAPHNLYTSTDLLRKGTQAHGYSQQVFFQKMNFKDDEPLEMRPATETVVIDFSKPLFLVRYEYDRQTNTYKRSMAGKPHIDPDNNQQISPKNVVVQYAPISNIANDPKGRMQVNLIGTGQGIVFQDGKMTPVTWRRETTTDITHYYDAAGIEMKLNRGQTWFELVDLTKMKVSFN
ncbi:MAG: DUF3048 domain-containing protein [Candidatus Aquicultor sp.]